MMTTYSMITYSRELWKRIKFILTDVNGIKISEKEKCKQVGIESFIIYFKLQR